ncbi:MAG: O-acetylhomoserine aminocarboxypropyltransferase/cysteine synthase [Prevotella sp.]|nr:O-acetylhomoserine aminocarboxypropyltransferase/cysteine synthase [Prevotella sp.]
MTKKLKPGSLCLHSGYEPKNGEPIELPIVQSTTFKYDNSDEMALLFDLKKEGYFYTRLQNPTNDAVARKIATLEGGVGAVLTSSGQAANFYAVFNICEAGDHIVTSNEIYGGTFNLFGVTLKKLGIECTFVNQDASDEEIQKAFRPNTKAMFGETISNPGCKVLDIEKFARIAHKNGVPLIVDNTFATPINCRPFEWGCDIVTHSTTKYMDGHATQVGGCVVDSGNFNWLDHADKFPGLCTPDESYHGLTYAKAFGKMGYTTKLVAQLMRDLGSIPAPQNSFLLNLGLETLALRIERHCRNAEKVAQFLHDDPRVAWIDYPGLADDKCHALAEKYLPDGSCGVMAFGLKGDRDTAIKFMDSLEMINIVTHVADVRTCVLHPASHTHRQLSEEQLKAAGIAPDLIRLSVGIEDVDDIIADIKQAMDKCFELTR